MSAISPKAVMDQRELNIC